MSDLDHAAEALTSMGAGYTDDATVHALLYVGDQVKALVEAVTPPHLAQLDPDVQIDVNDLAADMAKAGRLHTMPMRTVVDDPSAELRHLVGGAWQLDPQVVGPSGETAPTTGPASTQSAEDGAPVGTDTPEPAEGVSAGSARVAVGDIPQELIEILDRAAGREHSRTGSVVGTLAEILTAWERRRATLPACCGGSGFADYAAVPCPNPECTAPPCGGVTPADAAQMRGKPTSWAVIDAAVAWRARIHGGSEASAGASHPNLWGDERDFALIEAVDAYLAAKQAREAAKMEPQTPGARLREAFGEAQTGGRP